MGFLSCTEPQNRLALPHTPPDLVNLGYSSSSHSSSRYSSCGPPPKDVSWLPPKPPISPPMSSHDRPPPSPQRQLQSSSSARPSSSGGMSAVTTTSARSAIVTSTIADAATISVATETLRPPADVFSRTAAGAGTSVADYPGRGGDDAALALDGSGTGRQNAPPRQQLPSLSSLFGPPSEPIRALRPSPLERGAVPPSEPTPEGPPPPTSLSERPRSPLTSAYFTRTRTPPAAASRGAPSHPQALPASYDVSKPLDDRPTSASAHHQQPYHYVRPLSPASASRTSFPRPPSPRTYEQVRHPSPYHQDGSAPLRASERPPLDAFQLSPRPQEHENQLQQQRYQEGPPPSHQWPDSRSGYVAVGKWSLRQDAVGTDPSPSREQHHNRHLQGPPEGQRYQPLPRLGISDFQPQHRESQRPYEQPHPHQTPLPPPPPPPSRSSYPPTSLPDSRPPPLTLPESSSSMSGSLPSTPASAGLSEGLPSKDGLGPKIWTGTQFLPRFVGAKEVPGEGMCYFYDDGSHCKTVIDGEAVNAHWGVTKAGKPRKRLAIACVTCREKKIKCDPDYPKCVQCEKFGRVCRFKNAPRGGNNTSPGTVPTEPDQFQRMPISMIRPPPESPRQIGYASNPRDSPRVGMTRPLSPDAEAMEPSGKRLRIGYDHYSVARGGRSPPSLAHAPPVVRKASPTPGMDPGRPHGVLPPLSWGGYQNQHQQQPPPPPPSQSQLHRPPPPQSPPRSSSYSHSSQSQQSNYQPYHYQGQPRSQPASPSQPEVSRTLLPPPRSRPDLPRIHEDVLRRSWHPDL